MTVNRVGRAAMLVTSPSGPNCRAGPGQVGWPSRPANQAELRKNLTVAIISSNQHNVTIVIKSDYSRKNIIFGMIILFWASLLGS